MKVFVAGATGAIGRPLVAELVRQGHTVTGMTRSKASIQGLKELGAEVARRTRWTPPPWRKLSASPVRKPSSTS